MDDRLQRNVELLQAYEKTLTDLLYSGFAVPPAYVAIGRLFAELFDGDKSAWQGFAATSAATITSNLLTRLLDEVVFKKNLVSLREQLIPTVHQADVELTKGIRKAYPLFDLKGDVDYFIPEGATGEYFQMLTYGTPEYDNLLAIYEIQNRLLYSPASIFQNFAGVLATSYYAISQAEQAESFMGKIFAGVFAGAQGFVLNPFIMLGIESQKKRG